MIKQSFGVRFPFFSKFLSWYSSEITGWTLWVALLCQIYTVLVSLRRPVCYCLYAMEETWANLRLILIKEAHKYEHLYDCHGNTNATDKHQSGRHQGTNAVVRGHKCSQWRTLALSTACHSSWRWLMNAEWLNTNIILDAFVSYCFRIAVV